MFWRGHKRDARPGQAQFRFFQVRVRVKMGNKTSSVDANLDGSEFASEYFLPSADCDYRVCDFLKDNGCGGDDGFAEVLDATQQPSVVEEGPYLVSDLLFDRPRVSHACLFAESSFYSFFRERIPQAFFVCHLSDLRIFVRCARISTCAPANIVAITKHQYAILL